MMPSLDSWLRETVAEDHLQRQSFARNALQRNLRADAQRRVSSSSSPLSVSVVECCWAKCQRNSAASPTASSSHAPYLFCMLSDGAVYLLNTSNFLKTCLMEPQSARRDRLVAMDCATLARDASAAFQCVVCVAVNGWLCGLALDPTAAGPAATHRLVELPPDGRAGWERAFVRFSPSAARVLAGAVSRAADGRYSALLCRLARSPSGSAADLALEQPWAALSHPNGAGCALRLVAWWEEAAATLFALWADGTAALIGPDFGVAAHTCVTRHAKSARVTAAAFAPPTDNAEGTHSGAKGGGVLAIALEHHIVMTFHVEVGAGGRELQLRPTHQTYCSQEIPVRDVSLFDSFLPFVLAVLLESGALLLLDAVTMELLHHRPVPRLFSPEKMRKQEKEQQQKQQETGEKISMATDGDDAGLCCYYIRPRERPPAVCLIEHNTAILLRP